MPPAATTHVHHVADVVVAQRQHLQLDEAIQRVNLGDPVVEQAQVLQVHQGVQPLDGLDVVEGQVWKEEACKGPLDGVGLGPIGAASALGASTKLSGW